MATAQILTSLFLALAIPNQLIAAGPAPVELRSTASFVILAGAGITTTGGGIINGNVGASPIAGSAIGVTCAQINGTIYAVDASGPACAVVNAGLLTTAKGDLTTAYNDARDRTPVPTGPNLNPGLIPGSGNIGGMNLAPGLYKFTTTALITGADVTLTGGQDDVWIFQCAQDLQLGSGISIILAGGAQAKNVFWQVGTSAVLGTFSVFKGTILADQAITMNTSSTIEGRTLAFSAGVVFNGNGAASPASPEIAVAQPPGTNLVDGVSTNNFGSVTVGGSTNFIFTITNSGDANLTGLGITIDGADASLFSVTVNPVAPVSPNGSTTFTVRFAPTSPGVKTAGLHIANNDGNENPFDLTLTGTGTGIIASAPEIAVEQPPGTDLVDGVSAKDFGLVLVGTNSSLIFTITNSGTANLTGLDITIDGPASAQFSVTASPVAPVTTNGSTTFTVRFTPASAGAKTAALHIANNDSDENPFDIALTGTGTTVTAPEIAVEQPAGTDLMDGVSSKDFGMALVGASSSLTFIITNSGNANLTGLGITIDGADAALFSVTASPVAPVTPNGSTTFTIQFAPLSSGPKTAALHIANNDSDENPFDIALTGSGTLVAAPEIAVAQPPGTDLTDGVSTKNFDPALVGTSSSLTFTVTNTGTGNLTGLGITIDGADSAMFSVTASPVAPVAPNGSTTFTVRFTPTSSGAKTAALHIANNDSDENPFDIALTGTGTAIAAPEIAVAQPPGTDLMDGVSSKNFGGVIVGANNSLTFTITNTGSANLTGLGVTIDGVDSPLFSVTVNPGAPVFPNGSTTFTVRFAPLSTGVKTAALHIANNDSDENPFDIALTGTGIGGAIVASTNVLLNTVSIITLNPQSGLFEQTVRVTNTSPATVAAVRLLIQALPADVSVHNASGTTNGFPYLQYNYPLAPGATVDFLVEYYRASRQVFPTPAFVSQETTPVIATATGPVLAVTDRSGELRSGRFLIEFTAIPGRTYAVQYSTNNMVSWITTVPTITAPANKVQWYDDGPPKTVSPPGSIGSRFYRVIQLP